MHKVIEPEEIAAKTNLSAPHTVHCLADGQIMISMLGDAQGQCARRVPAARREVRHRRPLGTTPDSGMKFNYDFWYQPRHNVMVSSEWAAPNTFSRGFKLEDVEAGKYGHRCSSGTGSERKLAQKVDLGDAGLIPLEVRFHHDPDSTHGFVGAALSQHDVALVQEGRRVAGRQGDRGRADRSTKAGRSRCRA